MAVKEPNTIQVDIVDSESQIFSGFVEYLVAPAKDGEIGIYPHHMSIIAKLKPGVLRLQIPAQESQLIFAISGGFLEVTANHATILADTIERTDELDAKRLEDAEKLALSKLASTESGSVDNKKAQISLEIAIAQLKALDYIKQHVHHS